MLLDKVLHFLPRSLGITNSFAGGADRQQPSNRRSIRSRRVQFTDKRSCFVCHLFALNELADFDPDIGERVQEACIRWSNFRGKEFNDAQDSLRSVDGKSKRGMEVRFPGEFQTREILVLVDIRNPAGLAVSEDSPRQSHAGRKRRDPTVPDKLIEGLPR